MVAYVSRKCEIATWQAPDGTYMADKDSTAGISYQLEYWLCRQVKVIQLWIQLGYFEVKKIKRAYHANGISYIIQMYCVLYSSRCTDFVYQ